MGAEQSTIDGSSAAATGDEKVKYGFHVLRIESGSPAMQAKLVPYFDYITNVNGVDVVIILINCKYLLVFE